MASTNKIARISGILYLIVVLTGIYSLAYVPKVLFDWNNAAITLKNISSSELLFRSSIISSVLCYIAFLFLPFFLYRLLRQVNELYAKSMVVLAVASVPVSFANLQNKLAILSLINQETYPKLYSGVELQREVMLCLDRYDNGILISMLFWGLWLLPFGYLVYKSHFLPRILGILLMLGCLGYIINFTGNILVKDYSEIGISKFISLPASLGEIGICLWLLVVGVKTKYKTSGNHLEAPAANHR